MPMKPRRPCSQQGCPRLTDSQYCDEHKKEAATFYNRYQRDPETAKRYGRAWQKIRKEQLRKQPLCEMCLRHGRATPADQVHHIKPLAQGGTHDRSNLMSICAPCHSAITMKESRQGG